MGVHKRSSKVYETAFQAYSVCCPQFVKETMNDFFTNIRGYIKKTTPVIMNGARLFSMVEFTKGSSKINMLNLTRYGSTFLDKNCSNLETDKEIYNFLRRQANKDLADQPDVLASVQMILPILASHYAQQRYSLGNPYLEGNLDGKALCFFYPISDDDMRGLKTTLIRRHKDIQKEIRREHLSRY